MSEGKKYPMTGTVGPVMTKTDRNGNPFTVLTVLVPGKPSVIARLYGKTHEAFVKMNAAAGSPVRVYGEFKGEVEIPTEQFGIVKAASFLAGWVGLPRSAAETADASEGAHEEAEQEAF